MFSSGPIASPDGVIRIRTSDRITFRRCRRKWSWSSHLRGNRQRKDPSSALWTGTAVHFALEDFHSINQYIHPATALDAFYFAWKAAGLKLPLDWTDQLELAKGMMHHYVDNWLSTRDPLQTYILDDRYQVEVAFEIELPLQGPKGEKVVHIGRIDRVAVDENGHLWLIDYKTAGRFDSFFLEQDPQINTYCWAADAIYDRPVAGFIYWQFLKEIPQEPRWLTSNRLSHDKRMKTTHAIYRKALQKIYGDVNMAPHQNLNFLNDLAMQETEDVDAFIRRDRTERNSHQIQAEGSKILMEVEEMLNPDLALYPTPMSRCSWDCDFQVPCILLDEGNDWEGELEFNTQPRSEEDFSWRQHLPAEVE